MTHPRRLAVVAALLPLVFGVAVRSTVSAQTVHAPHAVHVAIQSYKFGSTRLVVAPGVKVVWTNKDADNHTVTSDAGSPSHFDSRALAGGATFSMTFKKVGMYRYHCSYHPFMHGIVVVRKKA